MQETLSAIFDEFRRSWPFRWQGYVVAVIIAAVASIYTLLVPDVFMSTAQIEVGSNYEDVAPVHNTEVRLVNDSNLDVVVDRVDFGIDKTVEPLRRRLKRTLSSRISVDGIDTGDVAIQCRDGKAARARDICNVMLELFKKGVMENSDTAALSQELANQQADLSVAEKKLQDYRIAHLDIFGQGGIGARLDAARAAEETAAGDYANAVLRRDTLQAVWRSTRNAPTLRTSSVVALTGDALVDRLYSAYADLENLRARYSEDYPDVIIAQRQIQIIVRQYPPDIRMCTSGGQNAAVLSNTEFDADATQSMAQSLAIDKPTVDATAANVLVCHYKSILVEAKFAVDNLTDLNASAPPIQAELSRRTAQRDSAQDRVDSTRRQIQELDIGNPESLYAVVARPTINDVPVSPNRHLWMFVALLGAIGGGGLTAYLRGTIAGAFVSPSEIRRAFTLPFYGSVSQIGSLRDQLGKSANALSFYLAVGIFVATMLVLIVGSTYISAARNFVVGASATVVQYTRGFR